MQSLASLSQWTGCEPLAGVTCWVSAYIGFAVAFPAAWPSRLLMRLEQRFAANLARFVGSSDFGGIDINVDD